jgi:hypothetical protein
MVGLEIRATQNKVIFDTRSDSGAMYGLVITQIFA